MNPPVHHVPVLVDPIVELAADKQRVLDGTAGGGGHAARFHEAGLAVLAVDRDPDAVATLRARWPHGEVEVLEGAFDAAAVLARAAAFSPDMILLDLGVSSFQLDEDSRGFTFRTGSRLDMRMSRDGPTAAEYLNKASHDELYRTFREYGDERRARRLAREIERRRDRAPLVTSDDLVNAIRAALGSRSGPSDFARLFQAVRVAVNDELTRLERALPALLEVLAPSGHLAVITYHSGEDRLVKHTFRDWARQCVCPPELPQCQCRGAPLGSVVTRRPLRPSEAEIAANPRARSAKLRVFRKAVP